jgi:predicted alpha/beta-hydrolase family hydrolase
MSVSKPQSVSIRVDSVRQVSGLFQTATGDRALYVVAHGAGAGMTHPLMASIADGLAARRIATLRYQFPYMEHGSKRPDVPKVAHMTVRAAVAEASRLAPTFHFSQVASLSVDV